MRSPLSTCSATTAAPGRTPPCASRTTPLISAVLVCAAAALDKPTQAATSAADARREIRDDARDIGAGY
jgi:hypothetical protein